ncbi:hypothetical protein K488DRAFT_70526 [Vararia minispora EC-137]|uniref:Uncharacterized protein n=1 Tax=Vararia minispora EC-137 TaxID=1314806 RepID=A0ACB8QLG7_9AGAM|nr:hypothetical protein K488DRAFT_70526 [Vararia minispora EC-137]
MSIILTRAVEHLRTTAPRSDLAFGGRRVTCFRPTPSPPRFRCRMESTKGKNFGSPRLARANGPPLDSVIHPPLGRTTRAGTISLRHIGIERGGSAASIQRMRPWDQAWFSAARSRGDISASDAHLLLARRAVVKWAAGWTPCHGHAACFTSPMVLKLPVVNRRSCILRLQDAVGDLLPDIIACDAFGDELGAEPHYLPSGSEVPTSSMLQALNFTTTDFVVQCSAGPPQYFGNDLSPDVRIMPGGAPYVGNID